MVEQDLTVQIIKNEFTAEVYEDNMLFCLKLPDLKYKVIKVSVF
jgi:hypothetical protein